MKSLFLSLFFMVVASAAFAAGNDAKHLSEVGPDTRTYLISIQNALLGETTWKSFSNSELATSDYTAPNTYKRRVELVDADNNTCRWFTQSVAGFTVSTASNTDTTFEASLSSSTLSFTGGSAIASIIITGPVSIGHSVTLSFPILSFGAVSSVTGSRLLTFTE